MQNTEPSSNIMIVKKDVVKQFILYDPTQDHSFKEVPLHMQVNDLHDLEIESLGFNIDELKQCKLFLVRNTKTYRLGIAHRMKNTYQQISIFYPSRTFFKDEKNIVSVGNIDYSFPNSHDLFINIYQEHHKFNFPLQLISKVRTAADIDSKNYCANILIRQIYDMDPPCPANSSFKKSERLPEYNFKRKITELSPQPQPEPEPEPQPPAQPSSSSKTNRKSSKSTGRSKNPLYTATLEEVVDKDIYTFNISKELKNYTNYDQLNIKPLYLCYWDTTVTPPQQKQIYADVNNSRVAIFAQLSVINRSTFRIIFKYMDHGVLFVIPWPGNIATVRSTARYFSKNKSDNGFKSWACLVDGSWLTLFDIISTIDGIIHLIFFFVCYLSNYIIANKKKKTQNRRRASNKLVEDKGSDSDCDVTLTPEKKKAKKNPNNAP